MVLLIVEFLSLTFSKTHETLNSKGESVSDPVDLLVEVEAMRKIAEALRPLSPEAATRTLRWALDGYKTKLSPEFPPPAIGETSPTPGQLTDVAEVFAAASPKHGPDKALVAAYWVQQVKGQADFDSQTINSELKHLGHGVPNITVTLGALIAQRPQLVIQLRKEGSTRQARKRYRLTREGIHKVEQMMRRAIE
jgi:hypothetical protein